ncbi:MAG: AhpC/TSA family protein [Paramuribaculum sp.]|nr:AhpC/TSA family protein [Paramuribaculum sp.]
MKALIYAACAAMIASAAVSCTGTKTADTSATGGEYTLTLPTGPADDGMMAYMTDFDSDRKLDSVIIANGAAAFSGTLDTMRVVRVLIDGKRRGLAFLEAGDITIDSVTRTATGTPMNNDYVILAATQDSLMEIYRQAKTGEITPDSVALATRMGALKAYRDLTSKAIAANQHNPLGEYLLLQEGYEQTPAGLDSLMAAYPAIKPGIRLSRLRDAMRLKAETMPGKKFKDFEVTTDGVTSRLSDHVGKGHYTLVDFWASWCGPCIRETETLKRIYNAYADKGLEILGVAVWDENDATRKAIETHKLPWNQIIGTQRIATDVYGISSIPCIILFDPEGTIVARDLTGAQLEDAVAKAMYRPVTRPAETTEIAAESK